MEDCLFCKIIKGEIPSTKVYEDDRVYAFYDIDKKAPEHILIIPKKHMSSMLELQDGEIAAALFFAANIIAKEKNLDETGFRTVINTGKDGGQTVSHLHMHLLGGRSLAWPPG